MTAAPTDDPKVVKMNRQKAKRGTSWKDNLLLNDKGTPKACLANAIDALRYAPEWDGVLWHDEFAVRTIARNRPPFPFPSDEFSEFGWTDRDDILTAEWLQRQGIGVNSAIAAQAVEAVAHERRFHPVRDYLDSLQWDGKHRNWLDYLGVPNNDYTQAVGARWMISAVARIYEPGCKADCALILEGPQGLKKSTALNVLGGAWFTDQISVLGSKDSSVDLQGAWIIELDELYSISRGEVGAVKAFMSRKVDRFRPPYGRRTVMQPRQCVFAGTVNPEGSGYLKDATGGRRFWPVECTKIDIEALKRDRDQFWAQAVALYHQGFPWWLDTQDLEDAAKEQQAERLQGDAWEGLIAQYLTHHKVSVRNDHGDVVGWRWEERAQEFADVSTAEILANVFEKDKAHWSKADEMRIARLLTGMGFVRYRPMVNGQREYRYRRACPTSQGGAQGKAAENSN
jgi:predicted P-loop ATPase